jgi:hypothetical protein
LTLIQGTSYILTGVKGDRVRGGKMGEGLGVGIKVRVKDEKSAGQYKGG